MERSPKSRLAQPSSAEVPVGALERPVGQAGQVSESEPWYAVRCVFAFVGDDGPYYDERVTIWRASSFDAAIVLAEADAEEHAEILDATYLGGPQAFHLFVEDRPIEPGDEVFSLIRRSDLGPDAYLSHFFDTGREHQGRLP